jgi:hypothetical protein
MDQITDTFRLTAASGDMKQRHMAAGHTRDGPLKDREKKKKQSGRGEQPTEQALEEQQNRLECRRGKRCGLDPTSANVRIVKRFLVAQKH